MSGQFPGMAEAVDAATWMLNTTMLNTTWIPATDRRHTSAVVAAAYPTIAAAVREQVAREIETAAARHIGSLKGCALLDAARIARGMPDDR